MQMRGHRPRTYAAFGSLLLALLALVVVLGATTSKSAAAPSDAAAADAALIACGTAQTIGFAAPITGPVAAAGAQMVKWGRFAMTRWNATHPDSQIRLVMGDTQLPDSAQAVRVAESFASNDEMLVVVGPAGSQEVQVSTAPLRRGGLANISGTASATTLTSRGTRRGYFFRTVPNDDQQSLKVVTTMRGRLRATRIVIIDAQTSYSEGLANEVGRLLRTRGIRAQRESVNESTVSDFSSLITRIPSNTQVVYIPWQIASKAQQFGEQLRASGRRATLFGSDGLYVPDDFKIPGSYVSAFPVAQGHRIVRAYARGPGNGRTDLFGLPSYVAVEVAARAVERACTDGEATRAEVRTFVNRTNIPAAASPLGFPVRFQQRAVPPIWPGDMRTPAAYIVYRISPNGRFVPVG